MAPKDVSKSSVVSPKHKPIQTSTAVKSETKGVQKKVPAKRMVSPDEAEIAIEPVTPSKRQRVPSRAAIESKESKESFDKSKRQSPPKKASATSSARQKKSKVAKPTAVKDKAPRKQANKSSSAKQMPVVVISDDEIEVDEKPVDLEASEDTVGSDEVEPEADRDGQLQASDSDDREEVNVAVGNLSDCDSQEGGSDLHNDGGEDASNLLDDEAIEDEDIAEDDEPEKQGSDDDDHYPGDEIYDNIQNWTEDAIVKVDAEVINKPSGIYIEQDRLIDVQLASIVPLIERGLLTCRRDMSMSVRFENGDSRNANAASVYMELQTCRDVIQLTDAMNFLNDGVYINPSRADPGLVKVVDAAYRNNRGEKLVLRNGPAASFGNAVFVSVVVVEDVKLREAVYLSGGSSERRQKWVAGCLFHGESELKAGFLGAAFRYDSAVVSRESGAETFTTRMSSLPTSSAQSSPARPSRFTERAATKVESGTPTSASSYASWPISLTHESPVSVFDFTALDSPFDFSEKAWSELHRCPKYALRFGEDEIGSDGVIGLVGYTVNSYVAQDERVINQNVMFLAILARAGGVRSPLIDRAGLQKIKDYASRGGDLKVHPMLVVNEQPKSKGKSRAITKVDVSPKSSKSAIGKASKASSSKKN